jgi:hypothetical protein
MTKEAMPVEEEQTGDKIFVPVPDMIWKHDAALLRSRRSATVNTPQHDSDDNERKPSVDPNNAPPPPRVTRKRASLPFISMKAEGLHKDGSGRLWAGDYLLLDRMDFKTVGLDVSDTRGLFVRLYARTEHSLKTVDLGRLSAAGFLAAARQVSVCA